MNSIRNFNELNSVGYYIFRVLERYVLIDYFSDQLIIIVLSLICRKIAGPNP